MSHSFIRLWIALRRFLRFLRLRVRRSGELPPTHLLYANFLTALISRADPAASWQARCVWLIELVNWLQQEDQLDRVASVRSSATDEAPTRPKSQRPFHRRQHSVTYRRLHFFLNWLETHSEQRSTVSAVMRTTLREALGPDLFCATGLQREPALLGELLRHTLGRILPVPPTQGDLSALFALLFSRPDAADWLRSLDSRSVARLWQLMSDDALENAWSKQIDEAMRYLSLMVLATGIGRGFRRRLARDLRMQNSPFSLLHDSVETYLAGAPDDCVALQTVRQQVSACNAQIEEIYAHLDQHGVSVGLVYHLEGMRAQLARILRLAEIRAAVLPGQARSLLQGLLADLVRGHHAYGSLRGLMQRNFSLLARKMVERNADHGEHYIARDQHEYRAMLGAAAIGGFITAFVMLGKGMLAGMGLARFFEGFFISLNFAIGFTLITALGGVLATKQPAVTAPALAARMLALDTVDGLRSLLQEITFLLRSQTAAVFGNLAAVVPTMLALGLVLHYLSDASFMTEAKAQASIASLSLVGVTPLFAAFTGLLLWLASLVAGFADNWFALHQLRAALACHPRLVALFGAARAARLASRIEANVASVVGNVALAFLLGMTPVVASFFGLPLDTRHVTLATASFTAAVNTLGWEVFLTPAPWLAIVGLLSVGLLNVGVAFACALALALQAREVPRRVRRIVLRQVLRRLATNPHSLFIAPSVSSSVASSVASPVAPPVASPVVTQQGPSAPNTEPRE